MKNILTPLLLLVTVILHAQVTFTPNIISGAIGINGPEPNASFAADVDDDGDIDIVVSTAGPTVPRNKIYWFENVEDENFQRHTITEDYGSTMIEGIDFDRDGDIDIVSTDGEIYWFENIGNGNFAERIIPFNDGEQFTIYSGQSEIIDLDEDGDLDILLPTTSRRIRPCQDNTISWMENDGSQNFTPQSITCEEFEDANDLVAADFDGDGDLDFAATNGCNDVDLLWYENNGQEEFTAHFMEEINTCHISSFVKADLNSDGHMDFLIGFADDMYWYQNDGNGNFSRILLSADVSGIRNILPKDLDEDGDIDLLVALGGNNSIIWFENNGNEAFAETLVGENTRGITHVVAEDIDLDGDLDIVGCSRDGSSVTWFENDGQEFFYEHPIQHRSYGAIDVYGANVDGDNDNDVLSASRSDGKISWFENYNNVIFSEHVIGYIDNAVSVFATDVDKDGDMDILGAGRWMGWFENDGNQKFTEHIISLNTSSIETVHAIDVDRDGDMDILTDPLGLYWYENDGNQNFTERQILSNTGAQSIVPADVNGDGEIDLVSAFEYNNQVGIFYNDGNENFTEQYLPSSSFNAEAVMPTDIDQDNDMDILAITGTPYSIVLYKNDGLQNFNEQLISLDIFRPTAIIAGDINKDGQLDIITTAEDGIIAWHENDGNTRFTEKIISSNSFDPQDVFAIDLDMDGDLDLISNSEFDNQVVVFINDLQTTPTRELSSKRNTIDLKLFPSPASDFLNLEFNMPEGDEVNMAIYNMAGIKVQELHQSYFPQGNHQIKINDLNLNNGLYILKIQSSSLHNERKFFIAN